jgi:endoglycosylceramidase
LAIVAPIFVLVSGCGGSDTPADTDAPRCSITLPEPSDWRLDTEGTRLRDKLGRVVVLRGANTGGRSKLPPYVPFDFAAGDFDAALARYLDRAQKWGFSAVRVPFSWAAVEPMQGMDDETFLARYDALLDAAWQRRMWTIVDFHQDIYAERFCGDGFPDWTIPEPKPAPEQDCADWFLRYGQNADVRSAFDRLWANENGTRTALESMWDRMSLRYRDKPGVIGFEVINEPHPGTAELKNWQATVLTDFYSQMASRIHDQAPQSLVFFDASGTDAVGATTSMGKPAGERLVFAPHWYDPAALFGGTPLPSNAHTFLAKWAEKGREWDVPVLIGESGVSRSIETAGEFVSGMLDAMDENGLHFTYWEYSDANKEWNQEDLSLVGTDGVEAKAIITALVRPFPRAVAGEAPAYRFDAAARIFTLTYDAPLADGVTEIAIPEGTYPEGYRVELSTGCVDNSHSGLLLVQPGAGSARVELEIHPR